MDIEKLIGSKKSVPSIDFNQIIKSDTSDTGELALSKGSCLSLYKN